MFDREEIARAAALRQAWEAGELRAFLDEAVREANRLAVDYRTRARQQRRRGRPRANAPSSPTHGEPRRRLAQVDVGAPDYPFHLAPILPESVGRVKPEPPTGLARAYLPG